MEVLQELECEIKNEALNEEQNYINNLKPTLNSVNAIKLNNINK